MRLRANGRDREPPAQRIVSQAPTVVILLQEELKEAAEMRTYPGRAIVILVVALALEGCATTNQKINVSVSQMGPYLASKGPGCDMPVFTKWPKHHFKELAIVEGWAPSAAKGQELVRKLKDSACEMGADALLVTASEDQKANPQNSIEVADRIQDEADQTADETVDQQFVDTYRAVYNGHGLQGTPGHGGLYMDTYAIKFVQPKQDE